MRLRRWIAALAGLTLPMTASPAVAMLPAADHARAPALEAAAGRLAATPRVVRWGAPPPTQRAAWGQLAAEWSHRVQASWDPLTGVPSRIMGAGVPAPNAVHSAAAAKAFARSFLERHLSLLAPGAELDDFSLATNHTDGAMRTVGLTQSHRGMPVLGGQLSLRFKQDRLFVVASEAWPNVTANPPDQLVSWPEAEHRAIEWIRSDPTWAASALPVSDRMGPVVLPLRRATGVEYAVVVAVTVAAARPAGRWLVYLDAETGAPVAREQRLQFAAGTLVYDAPVRYPAAQRADYPAAHAHATVDGAATTADDAGLLSWAGTGQATVLTGVSGTYVTVHNAAGQGATATLALAPGDSARWSDPDTEYVDAQLSAYIHANVVREHVRAIEPSIPWLDEPLALYVNEDDECNAYSDLQAIHFYRASGACQNTARLADVVYHEYGHTVHYQALLEGVGAYEGGLSEGLSDYLAATIVDDPAVAPGFFYDGNPLRQIDPYGYEHVWPDDIGESHTTGLIISGALWDLRTALRDKLGEAAGTAQADYLMVQGMRRAVDIPSMYVEVLAADDDDGDLDNGTPNLCEINAAFGRHGLRALSATLTELTVEPPGRDGYRVVFQPEGLATQCPDEDAVEAELEWRLRESPSIGGTIAMGRTQEGYQATIPGQADGQVVQYAVEVTFGDDAIVHFPANPADRFYEFFVGHTEPLYCTGFEADPAAEGWSHDAVSTGSGHDEWQWGEPEAPRSTGDPEAAFEGTRVFGTDLGRLDHDGLYAPEAWSYAESPLVDTSGYDEVRLQYRRWLAVEDGFYDQARILVGSTALWKNHDSDEEGASLHHRDAQWRFHDVDLTRSVDHDQVAVRFDLKSDQGLHFGGWTLDALCIVGFVPTLCGDGRITGLEQCDDGPDNSDVEPDACRSDCQAARCGDGIVDADEECDDGGTSPGDDCEPDCTAGQASSPDGVAPAPIVVEQCGCRQPGHPVAPTTPLWMGLLALLRRRRSSGAR